MTTTPTPNWRAHAHPTADGHLLWTGPRGGAKGELRLSRYDHRSPRRFAYAEGHGRTPEGRVHPNCGIQNCIEPAHLTDHADRQLTGALAAYARGYDPYDGECPQGHWWADTAVFEKNGVRRCVTCDRDRRDGRPAPPPPVDEFAVQAAIDGYPVHLNRRERLEAARLLDQRGAPAWRIAHQIGVAQRTVHRWRGTWREEQAA